MKKLFYVFIAALIGVGCKKSDNLVFDERPEVRMQKSIEEVNNALVSAPNGWVAALSTQTGGGYGFYMHFDANQNVKMVGDLNNTSIGTIAQSTYRVKVNLGPLLIFDTYNYISLLSDPNSNSFGGITGAGYRSDVEFVLDRIVGDSILFTGKKYRQTLSMVKATAAQKQAYEGTGFKTSIDKFKDFFLNTANPYIDVPVGGATVAAGISFNFTNDRDAGKRMNLTGLLADGKTVVSTYGKFGFTVNGVEMPGAGNTFEGIKFTRFAWKDANTLAMYDATGKEYIVKSSVTPQVPLDLLWGSKYKVLMTNFKSIYPGTSTAGAEILNFYHLNLDNAYTGYRFNYGDLSLEWNVVNKRLTLKGFHSQNGGTSGWTTSIVYNYTMDANNVYKFTLQTAASGGYVSSILTRMNDFLINNQVKFGYHTDGADLYCKMSSVTNPAIDMTWKLQ